MRCPKCHYISFESADRCRNCGYEYSLATASTHKEEPELPLNNRTEDPLPAVDLSLEHVEGLNESRSGGSARSAPFDIDRLGTSADLPLFKTNGAGAKAAAPMPSAAGDPDAPLVRPSAVPRAPIAVRRATPDVQRMRSRYSVAEVPRLDLDAPPEIEDFPEEETSETAPVGVGTVVPAPAGRRILAAVLDALIVSSINLGVLYFTLRLCELPLSVAGVLEVPAVPLVGFLVLIDGGYFVSFTSVVGQTIGKMATGLRVVRVNEAGEDDGRPNFGFATLRTAAYGASVLPLGLGFLPALTGKDRRALHDRLAETRVVFSGKLMV